MTEAKLFHIGDVLSVTHDVLVSPRHMVGLHDILNFMTGDQLFDPQLGRAADECKGPLLRKHLFLAEISDEGVGRDNWETWLNGIIEKHGTHLEVEKLPRDGHGFRHPVEELENMIGVDRVHIVKV